jgi:hypothetical protein
MITQKIKRDEQRYGKPHKKNQTNFGNKKSLYSTKITVEVHSNRLEQVKDRIAKLKDK